MQYFVRAGSLKGFPELVRELGQNPSKLLREQGLTTGVLDNPDLYVPGMSLARLLVRAARVCGEPAFGLRLGSRQGLEMVGALGSFLCLQPTIGEGLVVLQKNLGFHARGANLQVETDAHSVAVSLQYEYWNQTDCDQLAVLGMAVLSRSIAQVQQHPLAPLEVSLTMGAPGARKPYPDYFGCKVRFAAATNTIRYPLALLRQAVTMEPRQRERLTELWRGDWSKAQTASVEQQVERAVSALLPTGELSLQTVSSIVGLRPRTLQARLQQEGCRYGDVLQRVRQRLACQHLQHSDIDLSTLALDLGFAELSVFSRVFKTWYGVSPSVWRERHR
jgi:AraC-like DNA-binding protein